jgi:mono/diheme cytochrome c family protein
LHALDARTGQLVWKVDTLIGRSEHEGAYSSKGMARFDDVLSAADAEAIHAYLIDQAWQLKQAAPTVPGSP